LPLAACVALAVAASAQVGAQEAKKPRLLITVDEKAVVVEGQDIEAGQSASVDESGEIEFFASRPTSLAWPCGTAFAGDRGNVPKVSFDDLPEGEKIQTVAENFFQNATVLDRQPHFLNGGSHGAIPAAEIDQFLSEAYWYMAGPPDSILADQRPQTLLISLFFGTGQVVVDNNFYGQLRDAYGDEPIPVLFLFHDENIVPISYFGDAPTPGNVLQVYKENGILPAEPPMMFAGDKHVEFDSTALADLLGAPPLDDIDPDRRRKLERDIMNSGFGGKAVNLAMVPGGEEFTADEGQRMRVAAAMGIGNVPVQFTVFDTESHARLCGLAPPVGAAGTLGSAQGDAPGANPPQETADNPLTPPSPPEPPAPPPPAAAPPPAPPPVPPEIVPPDPPPPELPPDPTEPEEPTSPE
jgi:hypothetical protein